MCTVVGVYDAHAEAYLKTGTFSDFRLRNPPQGAGYGFANKMAGQTLDQKSSDSRVKELIHQLPFIQNVPLASLLDLRQEEEESFQCYRDAIRSAASLARESNDVDSLQSIKDNILSPTIYKIDAIIKIIGILLLHKDSEILHLLQLLLLRF